jgi:hypothetical protein
MVRQEAGSEFFRSEHGPDQVPEAPEREEADEDVFHGESERRERPSAKMIAPGGVPAAEEEDAHREGDEGDVGHDAKVPHPPAGA